MSAISGNIVANQNAYNPYAGGSAVPFSQGMADFSGPFGLGQGLVRGAGTVQIGPAGVSTSVPFAPGFSATPANTHNGLGLASPFATTNSYLNQLGMNSFGQVNPYTPLIGTPWDIPNSVMALGSFGGLGNAMSPYTGAGLPQSDGSFAFGGPGGAGGGTDLNSINGMPGGGGDPFAYPGIGGGIPGTGGGYPGGSIPGMGGGYPGGGIPGLGGGYPGGGASGDIFGNSGLFAPVDQNTIPGLAQSFTHQGENFANRYNLVSDGVARLFLQGQGDPNTPRSQWGSGSSLRSPYGIFESSVGWAGGNANAGVMGAQASGMAWAMVRNPVNPAMITSYANPYYNNYNFNEGFTNA